MAEKFRVEDGLLLSDDHTLVGFADGCAADAGGIIPGAHETGEVVPCPDCPGEHRITSALVIPTAHNITEVEPEEDELGS